MHFLQIAKHSPDNCPVYNQKYTQMTKDWFNNVQQLGAKYGVKMTGFYNDHPAHTVYAFYEAPSSDAMMGFMMEPMNLQMLSWQTMDTKPVLSGEDVQKMLGGH